MKTSSLTNTLYEDIVVFEVAILGSVHRYCLGRKPIDGIAAVKLGRQPFCQIESNTTTDLELPIVPDLLPNDKSPLLSAKNHCGTHEFSAVRRSTVTSAMHLCDRFCKKL